MKMNEITESIEASWGCDGLFGRIREGIFNSDLANLFLTTIKELDFENDELLPKRLISMLWYLPIFLEWQRERVRVNSDNIEEYEAFVTNIQNALEDILGIP